MKPIQKLEDEYIVKSQLASVSDRLEFLEEFRLLLPESVFIEKQKKYLNDWGAV